MTPRAGGFRACGAGAWGDHTRASARFLVCAFAMAVLFLGLGVTPAYAWTVSVPRYGVVRIARDAVEASPSVATAVLYSRAILPSAPLASGAWDTVDGSWVQSQVVLLDKDTSSVELPVVGPYVLVAVALEKWAVLACPAVPVVSASVVGTVAVSSVPSVPAAPASVAGTLPVSVAAVSGFEPLDVQVLVGGLVFVGGVICGRRVYS